MEVFRTRGYEGATLLDLQEAMGGITPTSLYAAFGSKEKLFREAVELYVGTVGAPPLAALNGGATARASIEGLLKASVDTVCHPGRPRGCLVVLGAIHCTESSREVREHLRSLRQLRPKFIKERLTRGIADGDLPKDVAIDKMASFLTTVLDGLATQAQDGASRSDLFAAVDYAMTAWDAIVTRRPGRSSGRSPAA